MRILMLSEFYLPIRGGIEQHVRSLSRGLAARGHEVAIATLWREGRAEFEMDGTVRIYRLRGSAQRASFLYSDKERAHVPPLPDPELIIGLRKVIARERPEIVHAHNWLVHSFLPCKSRAQAPLVVTLHDYGLVCATQRFMHDGAPCSGPEPAKCAACAVAHYGLAKGMPTSLAHSVMSAAERAAVDLFLPVSSAVARGSGLVGGKARYEVVPNFVSDDVAVLRGGMEEYTAQLPHEEYVLFVGDVSRDKGVPTLLDAYAGLKTHLPLVLIGRLGAGVPSDLPANVHFLQNWSHDAVMHAWAKSYLAVAPSIWPDPCPTVVMEAMASGKPVIASRIGGLPDLVVDGKTGVLVPPGNAAALREALECLISNPSMAAHLGQAGEQAIIRFRASTVVPRIEQLYQELRNR